MIGHLVQPPTTVLMPPASFEATGRAGTDVDRRGVGDDTAMGRFLLSAMPFTGHVTPMTTVARELVERGHSVRIYTGTRFRDRVEAAGATLVPWRAAPDFDENNLAETFPRLVGAKGMRQLFTNVIDCFIATAPAQAADLMAEWERTPWDVVAADETSVGTVLYSEWAGMPWATVSITPLNLAGTVGPPSGLGLSPGTHPLTRARDAVLRGLVPVMSRPISSAIGDARRAIGLPQTSLTMDKLVFSRRLIVASGSSALDYDRPDRPEHLHFVGELRTTGTAAPSPRPAWWPDLEGRTVVLVSQGTQNIDPEDLLRPTLSALADRDVLVVATTGVPGRDTVPFEVPANARVAGFVPFADLLPHADVMVTNGGWGGTLAALSHGIPLVIAGGDLDKPEVAARVAWAGAGINLRTGTPSASAVAAALDRIVADGSFRANAARVGEGLRALGGAPRAAELLEGLL